jgi:hypothetical protein
VTHIESNEKICLPRVLRRRTGKRRKLNPEILSSTHSNAILEVTIRVVAIVHQIG